MPQQESRNVFSDKIMSAEEAVYIAAIVDGEGTLSIWPHKAAHRRNYSLAVQFSIAGTDRAHMESLIVSMGNGRLDIEPKSDPKLRCCYRVALTVSQIRHVLPQIRPYLRLKTRQADLILEYFALQDDGRGSGLIGVSDDDWPRAVAIYEEMRGLNQRGQRKEDREFLIRDRKSLEIRPCAVEACEKRGYRSHKWCYDHWREFGEHPEATCEECSEVFRVTRGGKRFCSRPCANRNYLKRQTHGNKGQYRKLTEETVRAIVDAFNAGDRCMIHLAERFGTNKTNVRSILTGKTWARLGLDLPDPSLVGVVTGENHWTTRQAHPQRGERHSRGGAKLTEEQVREIRRRYAAGGLTHKKLAEEFGVAPLAITHICIRKTWAHLADE